MEEQKEEPRVEVLSTRTAGKRGLHRIALCRCGCGREFEADYYKIKIGHTKSCGCLSRKLARERLRTHGMRMSREYRIWCGMKRRCLNPKTKHFERYGGRGIAICDAWIKSFEQFFSDMGPCPNGLSIERKDTNGNYDPSNCVWADNAEQARNKRNNRFVEYDGKMVLLKDLAMQVGIRCETLRYRIINLGLTVDQAVKFKKHHYARKQNFGGQDEQ